MKRTFFDPLILKFYCERSARAVCNRDKSELTLITGCYQAWVLKKSPRLAAEIQGKHVKRSHALLDFDGWRLADHDGAPIPR